MLSHINVAVIKLLEVLNSNFETLELTIGTWNLIDIYHLPNGESFDFLNDLEKILDIYSIIEIGSKYK